MDQETFLAPIKKFCREKIEPTASADDEASLFRSELYKGLADLGVTATMAPEAFGGLELSSLHYAWALEEIARTSIAYSVSIAVSGLVQTAITKFGTDEQKKAYLSDFASGKILGVFGLTEITSGSDAAALKTKAVKAGGDFVLTGNKQFLTNGGLAELHIVFARTAEKEISAFLVPKKTAGLTIGKKENKMGWRSSPTTSLHLDQCRVPASSLVGKLGDGFKIAMSALDSGRVNISAMALGMTARVLEEATRYASERKQFGQPIMNFQGISFMLADIYTNLEAGRSLLARVAQLKDEGKAYTHLAAALKCFTTDHAMKATTDAVQVFGGSGYMKEYPLERFMRDAKVLQIVEGTNQIQRVVIGRYLQKTYGEVQL